MKLTSLLHEHIHNNDVWVFTLKKDEQYYIGHFSIFSPMCVIEQDGVLKKILYSTNSHLNNFSCSDFVKHGYEIVSLGIDIPDNNVTEDMSEQYETDYLFNGLNVTAHIANDNGSYTMLITDRRLGNERTTVINNASADLIAKEIHAYPFLYTHNICGVDMEISNALRKITESKLY